jgi:hypothetical protein
MPEAGEYLLTNAGFSSMEKPVVSFQSNNSFVDFEPPGEAITFRFDMSQRFCVGWRNITTGERFSCPDHHFVESKYEQCPACQSRTGFNPAFYHATSVSEQQEARNQEPHMLYLARFGRGVIKVGISHAKRGNARLLEQGARDALILETFPSAHIARQYEAKIAALPDIAESLQLRKKLVLLTQSYDHTEGVNELEATRERVEEALGATFPKNDVLCLDDVYFPYDVPTLSEGHDCSKQNTLSGTAIGMLGTILFCIYKDSPVFLPLKKYIGYNVAFSQEETALVLPAQQTSLF